MLPVEPPLVPMLARAAEAIPEGAGLLYEPKWDGFRTLVFRDGAAVRLLSRNGLPLGRYFPEAIEIALAALPDRCVLDTELVIAGERGLDFDALQLRLHPAESRVRKLAAELPAQLVAFDLLALGDQDLRAQPLRRRRETLAASLSAHPRVGLTPQTSDPEIARGWFDRFEGAGLDGVMVKQEAQSYLAGERGWVKVKHHRTADCVVGGYRVATGGGVGSLLLGVYRDGVLAYIGHTSSFSAAERRELEVMLEPVRGEGGFGEGRSPGGQSRWSGGRETAWVSLRPELVCEVRFDQLQGDRFRHASRFLRWRDDKPPEQCDWSQLIAPTPFELSEILALGEAQRH